MGNNQAVDFTKLNSLFSQTACCVGVIKSMHAVFGATRLLDVKSLLALEGASNVLLFPTSI